MPTIHTTYNIHNRWNDAHLEITDYRKQRSYRKRSGWKTLLLLLSNFSSGVYVTWKPRRSLMTLPSHVLQRRIQTSTNCLVPRRTRLFVLHECVYTCVYRWITRRRAAKGYEYFQVLNVCFTVAVCSMITVPTKCSIFLRYPISQVSTKHALMGASAFSLLSRLRWSWSAFQVHILSNVYEMIVKFGFDRVSGFLLAIYV